MVIDRVIITVLDRATGAEDISAEAKDTAVDTAGTLAHAGVNVTHPNLTIPKTVRGISAANNPTVTEVGRAYWRGRGVDLGNMVKIGYMPNTTPWEAWC